MLGTRIRYPPANLWLVTLLDLQQNRSRKEMKRMKKSSISTVSLLQQFRIFMQRKDWENSKNLSAKYLTSVLMKNVVLGFLYFNQQQTTSIT